MSSESIGDKCVRFVSGLAEAVRSERASQIVEFAVSLPLLLILIVGIFDFGAAFNVKQKLTNTMREAARFGSGLPTSDMEGTSGVPASITAIQYLVDSDITSAGINDCGLGTSAPVPAGASDPYAWMVTGTCAGITLLTIERQFSLPSLLNGQPTYVICTHVSINYPYQWHFNNVIQLLIPGTNYGAQLQIQTDALMPNMQ